MFFRKTTTYIAHTLSVFVKYFDVENIGGATFQQRVGSTESGRKSCLDAPPIVQCLN